MRYLLVVVVFVLAFASSTTQADTSSYDIKNPRHYGNCTVATTVDMFNDEEAHSLVCSAGTLTDTTTIVIRIGSDLEGFTILLSKGVQVHMEWNIPIAIRIDKGPLIKRDAGWIPEGAENAYLFDEQLARQLLHDLAHGQRVAIQVGDERGHIQLDGSQRAVADFRQRAGLPAQQTLTPQERQTLEIPARSF